MDRLALSPSRARPSPSARSREGRGNRVGVRIELCLTRTRALYCLRFPVTREKEQRDQVSKKLLRSSPPAVGVDCAELATAAPATAPAAAETRAATGTVSGTTTGAAPGAGGGTPIASCSMRTMLDTSIGTRPCERISTRAGTSIRRGTGRRAGNGGGPRCGCGRGRYRGDSCKLIAIDANCRGRRPR